MNRMIIRDIGTAFPSETVTNEQLATISNIDPAFVHNRLGIRSRRILGPSDSITDLASAACEDLLRNDSDRRQRAGALIVVTQSPDLTVPGLAAVLQDRMALPTNMLAFDLNLACSGYTHGLILANALLIARTVEAVILVTAETYSRHVDWRDTTVAALFGDAATASYLERSENAGGLLSFISGVDGRGHLSLSLPATPGLPLPGAGGGTNIDLNEQTTRPTLFMDGKEVFQFAVTRIPDAVEACLHRAGKSIEDLKYAIFHQANKYMLQVLAIRCRIPAEKMVIDLEESGNTVSSSIPLALHRLLARGAVSPDDLILFCGFGAGLSWSVCLYKV